MALPVSGDLRLLTRVLERVYGGVRRARALAESVDVPSARVNAALDAGEWLGVLTWDGDVRLTASGLAVAAGRRRAPLWARLVREHPFFAASWPPSPEALLRAAEADEPLRGKARRQARALWRMTRPARAHVEVASRQLTLNLATEARVGRPVLDLRCGHDDNPDVYAVVLRALLDHGELTALQLRAVLDSAGGERCGIGGYLAMAVRRGDARRLGDVLVVTPGAVSRGDLAESPVTVALSDPEFRVHVLNLLANDVPLPARFRLWGDRLFGRVPVGVALGRLLFDRPLTSVPVAGDAGAEVLPEVGGFLSSLGRPGLMLAMPMALRDVAAGLSGLNRTLRQPTHATMPGALDRRLVVHGGLVFPGEATPRAIPDGVSLRIRAVRNAPAFAVLVALGLLDRRARARTTRVGGELMVARAGGSMSVSLLVQTLAHARGWWWASGGLTWGEAAGLAQGIGLVTLLDGRLTVDEGFFHRLQTDAEHRAVYEALLPLVDALALRLKAA